MHRRRLVLLLGLICFVSCGIFLKQAADHAVAFAQSSSGNLTTFHAESRLVLVDTIVTDKKGDYVRDLTQKDFKVWEDGKEQTITSFSYEENTGSTPAAKPRYMVLFFDNSTMEFGDQAKARDAATKFIEANAGPDRLIAIAEFGGTVTITQNFTADADRLKKVVAGIKSSAVSPNPEPSMASLAPPTMVAATMPSLSNAEADFGVHTVLLALRDLAKGMANVPGRKTLVLLTAGFPLNAEYESEITATIDTCNKSNVAIYPIDVRGLVAPVPAGPQGRLRNPSINSMSPLVPAAFHLRDDQPALKLAAFAEPVADPGQHTGGGGGGGSGGAGGGGGHSGSPGGGGTGSGGGRGTGGGTGTSGGGRTGGGTSVNTYSSQYNNGIYNPYNQPRQIVPTFPPSASQNQQVMYQLADGTGGFVILNTNDLVGGLQRIARDQNQYYLLGYVPAVNTEGSCHSLKVKVERHGTEVRARSGYCTTRPVDLLAGNPVEKDLEARARGEMKGNVTASMEAPFFYTSPNTAQVHLAVEIPSSAMKFEKEKGKEHAALNILGIAYKPDNTIAARFSDTVNFDLEGKKEVEQFQKQAFHYQNQFGIGSGQYNLKVVFRSGNESFGKLEAPLVVDPYGEQQFSISGVALSDSFSRAADLSTDLDSLLLEDRTPLIAQGLQISPSATNHFKQSDNAAIYAEIYEPSLKKPNAPEVAYELIIVNLKTNQQKFHIGDRTPKGAAVPGNPVIALGLRLPVAHLDPGSYRLDLRAVDSAGNSSKTRSTEFEVE
jgi:VWFA-related protein